MNPGPAASVTNIVSVNCTRIRKLVMDPNCWNPGEIIHAVDQLQKNHLEALRRLIDEHKNALAAARLPGDCDGPDCTTSAPDLLPDGQRLSGKPAARGGR